MIGQHAVVVRIFLVSLNVICLEFLQSFLNHLQILTYAFSMYFCCLGLLRSPKDVSFIAFIIGALINIHSFPADPFP